MTIISQGVTVKYLRRILSFGAIALAVMVLWSPPAFGYIDPASGSFIIQMLLAAFFTLMFMLRRVREKIKQVFASLFRKKIPREPEE